MDLIALIWDWDILFHHSFWALLYRSPLLVSTLPFSFLKVNYLNNLHLLNLFFSSNTPLFSATTHSLFHSNNTFLFLFITLPHTKHSKSQHLSCITAKYTFPCSSTSKFRPKTSKNRSIQAQFSHTLLPTAPNHRSNQIENTTKQTHNDTVLSTTTKIPQSNTRTHQKNKNRKLNKKNKIGINRSQKTELN